MNLITSTKGLEMSRSSRSGSTYVSICVMLIIMVVAEAGAQHNNPYRAIYGWAKLPEGRTLGVVAGIYFDPDRQHMWLMDRCGGNNCAAVDPSQRVAARRTSRYLNERHQRPLDTRKRPFG